MLISSDEKSLTYPLNDASCRKRIRRRGNHPRRGETCRGKVRVSLGLNRQLISLPPLFSPFRKNSVKYQKNIPAPAKLMNHAIFRETDFSQRISFAKSQTAIKLNLD